MRARTKEGTANLGNMATQPFGTRLAARVFLCRDRCAGEREAGLGSDCIQQERVERYRRGGGRGEG